MAQYSPKGYKMVRKRDYSQRKTIVEQVQEAPNVATLLQMQAWFKSPAQQMSSKVAKKFIEAWEKRYQELKQQEQREHAQRSLSNQT